ncbi:MAG: M48 family metallopeptidase [Planctomycetes bacterium]|nr:M48 family metallopeptidase [Planctomycetota bacterium]
MPELRLTQETLTYTIDRRRRRTVGVVVRRDGRVEVHAPLSTPDREVRRIVDEFRPWVERKREEVKERLRKKRIRSFEDGDDVPFLGGTLRLSVIEMERPAMESVTREDDTLVVRVQTELSGASRTAVVRYAVVRWLLDEARETFHRHHVAAAKRVGASAKRVVVKDMASRWGSCGPDRKMSLNWRLIFAPSEIIDYVLVHELCHIEHPNHSRAFWNKVGKHCAGYRDHRKWLRSAGDELDL